MKQWIRLHPYCEINEDAKQVLHARMKDGSILPGPIFPDVRNVAGAQLKEMNVKVLIGGFPCQDISVAGNQRGFGGERWATTNFTLCASVCFPFGGTIGQLALHVSIPNPIS